jgi:hypothetical protein
MLEDSLANLSGIRSTSLLVGLGLRVDASVSSTVDSLVGNSDRILESLENPHFYSGKVLTTTAT